jgi:hypothetical protein
LNTFMQATFSLKNNFTLLTLLSNGSGSYGKNNFGVAIILRKKLN